MLALLFIVVFDLKFEGVFRWRHDDNRWVCVCVRVFVLCRLRLNVSRNKEATTISGAWSKLASTGYLYWSQTTVVIPTVGVIRLNLQACVYLCVCVRTVACVDQHVNDRTSRRKLHASPSTSHTKTFYNWGFSTFEFVSKLFSEIILKSIDEMTHLSNHLKLIWNRIWLKYLYE